MNLAQIIKILGWIFVVTPVFLFVLFSVYTIKGAMGDDDKVKALVMLCLASFFIGAIMLLLIYLTNIFPQILSR